MADLILLLTFWAGWAVAYALGRIHEVCWWLGQLRASLDFSISNEASQDWKWGNLAMHQWMHDALNEREKTWKGRWLAR